MSTKPCKCCGGNGWEGSNCESLKAENARLWRDYEFGQTRINNQRLEIVALSKDIDRQHEAYTEELKHTQALKRRIDKLENALKRIRDFDWPSSKDFLWKIAKEALE